MAPSPSGKARVCKTLITSSNLVGASNFILTSEFKLVKHVGQDIYIYFNSKPYIIHICRCGEMADARDLKSLGGKLPCRFESGHRHQIHLNGCFFVFELKFVLKVNKNG